MGFMSKEMCLPIPQYVYNGVRVKPGEHSPWRGTGYQIYVDWNKKSVSTNIQIFFSLLPVPFTQVKYI